jgi:hypothetical protein
MAMVSTGAVVVGVVVAAVALSVADCIVVTEAGFY